MLLKMNGKKIGRNDKCPCGSGKKYKTCCLTKVEQKKREELDQYENGHPDTSDGIKICAEYFREEYPDHKTMDISNYLNADNYRNFQVANYTNKVIMLAERNEFNKGVFQSRGSADNDLMIMYRGSYRVCRMDKLDSYVESIDAMIQKRLNGEEDN